MKKILTVALLAMGSTACSQTSNLNKTLHTQGVVAPHAKTEQIKQLQKASRIYRKQRNLTLTEKNWRQHVNRKAALSEVECLFMPTFKDAFFLAHNQQPTPYSIWNEPKK